MFAVVMVVAVTSLYKHVTRPVPAEIDTYAADEAAMPAADMPAASMEVERPTAAESPQFRCDGRTHCSQMTSCKEAKFFLRNCPGTQMDGEGDGIPCERQWCKHPLSP